MMKRFAICGAAAPTLAVASQAFAYHKTARKGCDEAMKLHEEGKHKESMIKAGETIAEISKALK
jgi:hypothetical protein